MGQYAGTSSTDMAQSGSGSLIAASKVNGTSIYDPNGESLGSIYDVMIDKQTGRVAYAVMAFGGFLGMGEDYHPLPWNVLQYNEQLGGYVVDIPRDRLKEGPTYRQSETPEWSAGYGGEIDDYYGKNVL